MSNFFMPAHSRKFPQGVLRPGNEPVARARLPRLIYDLAGAHDLTCVDMVQRLVDGKHASRYRANDAVRYAIRRQHVYVLPRGARR